MGLQLLGAENFRCLESVSLELDPAVNLISGDNASGKTSLLEAMFLLGRGRSFRTTRTETLIRAGSTGLQVTGRIQSRGRLDPVGIAVTKDGTEARLAGRPVKGFAELAGVLPIQAIDPDVHRLIDGGPTERRRFLDWGVFHVEPGFVDVWRRYQRGLRQRNAALRLRQAPGTVRAWDPELLEAGEEVTARRERYVSMLLPRVADVAGRLLGVEVRVSLSRGWSADRSLAESLELSWPRDLERGLTHPGPHRADLLVSVDGHPARGRVSRGQQKLLAAALLLGQLRCDAEAGSEVAALLVDDPAAELDRDNLGRLLVEIRELPAQLVVTALEPASVAALCGEQGHRFHVEHGRIRRLL